MNISTFIFSPTKTTLTVVRAMTSPFEGHQITETNWTHSENCDLPPETDLVIIGIPVYAGLVPTIVLERIQSLKGNQTPIILVTVYGNRSADTAPRELFEITSQNGFIPIAAAEFIGEHSYSTPTLPIAVGRPDADDLLLAKEFGKTLLSLLESESLEPLTLENFNQAPHRERIQVKIDPPTLDIEKCRHCGKCRVVCPQNIWPLGNDQQKGDCIRCCACIKVCDKEALTQQEAVHAFAVKLNKLCQERKEPKLVISKKV